MVDFDRPAIALDDAGDPGNVCGEDVAATPGSNAAESRKRC